MFLRPATRLRQPPSHLVLESLYRRHYAIRPETPTFPTTPTCPPSCACVETPKLPPELPIDRKTPLNGTMAPYAEQVLICTGQGDWISKIEEENSGDNLAADIKELLGRGGTYADVLAHYNFALLQMNRADFCQWITAVP